MDNMDENDSVDVTVKEEPFQGVYCKDVTSLLTRRAANQSRALKVTQELERERLRVEHEEMDKKITAAVERIERSKKVARDLNIQMYNANELKNQTMARFERTGEMINVLKKATAEVLSKSDNIEARRKEVAKKVEELKIQNTKEEQHKKTVETLEREIQKQLETPEPQLDPNLVQKNTDLKRKLKEKIGSVNLKRTKKTTLLQLENERLVLSIRIFEAQSQNDSLRSEGAKKRESLKENKQLMQEKLDEIHGKLKEDIEKRNALLKEYNKSIQQNDERQKKFDALRERVSEEEYHLTNLKQKIEDTKKYMREENVKKQTEYETVMQTLKTTERELQDFLRENDQYRQPILKKSDQIIHVAHKKCELNAQLCEKKFDLAVRQQQKANEKTKSDALIETLANEMRQLDEAKSRHAHIGRRSAEVRKELKDIPLETKTKYEEIASKHQEKKQDLLKQISVEKATMEILQFQLDETLPEIAQLKKEVQHHDAKIQWEEMRYNMKNASAEKFQARLESKKLKTKEDEKKQIQIQGTPLGETDVMEEEEKTTQSGRKSPGILKSPHKNPNVPPSNKHVYFEGLPPMDSSSTSTEPLVQDAIMDELLRDSAKTGPLSGRNRIPLDF